MICDTCKYKHFSNQPFYKILDMPPKECGCVLCVEAGHGTPGYEKAEGVN